MFRMTHKLRLLKRVANYDFIPLWRNTAALVNTPIMTPMWYVLKVEIWLMALEEEK